MQPDVITLTLTPHERAAVDEMRALLALRSDDDWIRAAAFKLAAWCEPDVDCTLFARAMSEEMQRRLRGDVETDEPALPLFDEGQS